MRYLHRTHRVSVAWLHERFAGVASQLRMAYEESENMCADIYTKLFTYGDKWIHACELIGVFDPVKLHK
eukprot:1168995-Lingulodinium_polyedra.AAC.1